MCRLLLIYNIKWMQTKFRDMLFDISSQEGQNLAPKVEINVAPQQTTDHMCTNEAPIHHPGYLHGHAGKPWMHLKIHASKIEHLKEIPICFRRPVRRCTPALGMEKTTVAVQQREEAKP